MDLTFRGMQRQHTTMYLASLDDPYAPEGTVSDIMMQPYAGYNTDFYLTTTSEVVRRLHFAFTLSSLAIYTCDTVYAFLLQERRRRKARCASSAECYVVIEVFFFNYSTYVFQVELLRKLNPRVLLHISYIVAPPTLAHVSYDVPFRLPLPLIVAGLRWV